MPQLARIQAKTLVLTTKSQSLPNARAALELCLGVIVKVVLLSFGMGWGDSYFTAKANVKLYQKESYNCKGLSSLLRRVSTSGPH